MKGKKENRLKEGGYIRKREGNGGLREITNWRTGNHRLLAGS